MQLATIRTAEGTRAAHVVDKQIYPLAFRDVRELLESGADWRARAQVHAGAPLAWNEVSFAPLIPRPEKIFGVGANYREHVAEIKGKIPDYPMLFTKFALSLIGAYDPIAMPPDNDTVDSEVELCIVIGRRIRRANADEARDAIAGFTIANDMSVRDWQGRTPFPLQGKAWEHMSPVGPVLVTADELDGAKELRLQGIVDDFTMQDSVTSDMIFGSETIVSYASTFITLEPGDLFMTGSPPGVGFARNPRRCLQIGQTLTSRIVGIGEMVNRCVPEQDWAPAPSRAVSASR